MWKFKSEIRKAQERDSDFVRVEGINIIDLNGLSSESLSSDTIDVVKLSSKISDFFPEVRQGSPICVTSLPALTDVSHPISHSIPGHRRYIVC